MKLYLSLVLFVAVLLCAVNAFSIEQQTQQCSDKNEIFNQCGTMCPVTCLNRHVQNRKCVMMCKIGCECKPGYIRIGFDATGGNGHCVPIEECSTVDHGLGPM